MSRNKRRDQTRSRHKPVQQKGPNPFEMLKFFMEHADISVASLSAATKINQPRLNALLNNKVNNFTLEELQAIDGALTEIDKATNDVMGKHAALHETQPEFAKLIEKTAGLQS